MNVIFYLATALCAICAACGSAANEQQAAQAADSVAMCHTGQIPSRFATLRQDSMMQERGSDEAGMVLIPAGKFKMGSLNFEDAQPIHEVQLGAFYMDEHEVTNAQFAAFVQATGYVTVAEQPLDLKDFPGVDPKLLVPGSAVFAAPDQIGGMNDPLQWWSYVPGANWQHPEGPSSTIKGREQFPVTQIAYPDATAYAKWVGKRLPTEAEWEYAAKAGRHGNETYYWGNDKKEDGKWLANIFQGTFPTSNTKEDGYLGTAPVKSFPANAWGLYDMEGNVWEWCADFYRPDAYRLDRGQQNPKGPADSYDPQEPGAVKRVQRGGSFLCNDQYCERYKAGSRGKGEVNSPTNNVGFRCVKDIS